MILTILGGIATRGGGGPLRDGARNLGANDMAGSVWGFFYGGLIDDVVMERVGFRPTRRLSAWLPGFELEISPLVNLVPSPGAAAFGLLLETTHVELDHVYGQLQARYVPIPVLAFDSQGGQIPALCYVVPDMVPGQAEEAHILPLLSSAEKLRFPAWYISRIRSFLPKGNDVASKASTT